MPTYCGYYYSLKGSSTIWTEIKQCTIICERLDRGLKFFLNTFTGGLKKSAQLNILLFFGDKQFSSVQPRIPYKQRMVPQQFCTAELTLSASASLFNVHVLLTISIQNMLFCVKKVGIDQTPQAKVKRKILSNCLTGKYGYHSGEFSNDFNSSFVVFGTKKIKLSTGRNCHLQQFEIDYHRDLSHW